MSIAVSYKQLNLVQPLLVVLVVVAAIAVVVVVVVVVIWQFLLQYDYWAISGTWNYGTLPQNLIQMCCLTLQDAIVID